MVEKWIIRTYRAAAEGRFLKIKTPINSYTIDLSSKDRALKAVMYIRKHGIECSKLAIERLIQNL